MPDEIQTPSPAEALEAQPSLKGEQADEGYELLEQVTYQPVTPEESSALAKELDCRLLLLMCVLYGICYIDKLSMSWAVLFDFREDLSLQGTEYSWGSSIFYFGLLVAQHPGNFLLQKLKISRVLGIAVLTLGVLMVACVSFLVSYFPMKPSFSCRTILLTRDLDGIQTPRT